MTNQLPNRQRRLNQPADDDTDEVPELPLDSDAATAEEIDATGRGRRTNNRVV